MWWLFKIGVHVDYEPRNRRISKLNNMLQNGEGSLIVQRRIDYGIIIERRKK